MLKSQWHVCFVCLFSNVPRYLRQKPDRNILVKLGVFVFSVWFQVCVSPLHADCVCFRWMSFPCQRLMMRRLMMKTGIWPCLRLSQDYSLDWSEVSCRLTSLLPSWLAGSAQVCQTENRLWDAECFYFWTKLWFCTGRFWSEPFISQDFSPFLPISASQRE